MQPQVLIVGGGMITHDQILPSLYHLQRQGHIGEIGVCALRGRDWQPLAGRGRSGRGLSRPVVPGYPEGGDPDRLQPDLFREVIARLPPRNIVVVAVPDHLHLDVILTALRHDQHVCTVKPLVLKHAAGAGDRAGGLFAGPGRRRRIPQAVR